MVMSANCRQTLRGDSSAMPAQPVFHVPKIRSTSQFHQAYDSNRYKSYPQNRVCKFYCTVMQYQLVV